MTVEEKEWPTQNDLGTPHKSTKTELDICMP